MTERDWAERIDPTVAHPARMYDFYLHGKDNYEVDRLAAEKVLGVLPEARAMALENRAFLGRAVRFLVDQGVRQFLDIGTGLPTQGNTNEVAHEVAPDARIVYVDNDPLVLAHARALLAGCAKDRTTVIEGDLRDPDAILKQVDEQKAIDFDQPVAVLLVAILHFIRDAENPHDIVDRFKRVLRPGSYLVISHGTQDFDPVRAMEAVRPYDQATAPFVLRQEAEIRRFFDGLELVEPGMVQIPRWRPEGVLPAGMEHIWIYGGIGRQP